MKERIQIWSPEEYHYDGADKFIPFLMSSIHEDEKPHPAMLVVPGGGYIQLSTGEADGVADQFFGLGYNTFVLVYTNNVTLDKPIGQQALLDISRAVRLIRKRHQKFHICPDQIAGIGFSAGGHLVASLATLFDIPKLQSDEVYQDVSNQLDAAVLSYPLITHLNCTSLSCYQMMLGADVTEEEIKPYCLEQRVTDHSAPMYFLHGTADIGVPAQNVLLMASACAEHNIPYELKLLLGCPHGFAVADLEPELVKSSYYLFEQLYDAVETMTDAELAGYADLFGELRKGMDYEEFAEIAQNVTMLKMWGTGLQTDLELLEKAEKEPGGNLSYGFRKNLSAAKWWLDVDQWIQMLFREDENK